MTAATLAHAIQRRSKNDARPDPDGGSSIRWSAPWRSQLAAGLRQTWAW